MILFNKYKSLSLFALLLALAAPAGAQVATAGNKLGWTEVAQTAAIAGGFTYNYYVDGSTTAVPVTGVACVAGVPATDANCSAPFPALSLGPHTIAMTQASGTAESTKSATLAFTFVVLVTPTGLKVVEYRPLAPARSD